MKRDPQQAGFTLVEVLIVISVLGVLLAIGLVNLSGARESARRQAARTHGYAVTQSLSAFIATYAPLPAATVLAPFASASSSPPGVTLVGAKGCSAALSLSRVDGAVTVTSGADPGAFGWSTAPPGVLCAMAAASANGSSRVYRVLIYTWVSGSSQVYLNGE